MKHKVSKFFLCLGTLLFLNHISGTHNAKAAVFNFGKEENFKIFPEFEEDNEFKNSVDSLLNSIDEISFTPVMVNKTFAPWVFMGYRNLDKARPEFKSVEYLRAFPVMTPRGSNEEINLEESALCYNDSIEFITESLKAECDSCYFLEKFITAYKDEDYMPEWLKNSLTSYRIQEDFIYAYMIENPSSIEYAYWDLPEPPKLLPDDISFKSYIKKLKLPEVDLNKAVIPEEVIVKRHWIHVFNALLQFSEAYVSPNWYQGGNNYLALLFNVAWNVQLNQVYHPNLLFQSNFSYKLALSSNPKGQMHKYTISEDILQYNLNTGIKAYKKWFYSFNLLFKTQLLNNYEENSDVRKAAFLSPGDLNMGLGMAYSTQNKKKTFQLTATISPLSYNLKTCISKYVDHNQFNISPLKKTKSEIGSNAELNMTWNITSNISYKTRLFLFTDYSYFLGDWENTFSFAINKFLSTQLYVHLRYDSSAESVAKWKKFMMREILSFGLSYTFNSKP